MMQILSHLYMQLHYIKYELQYSYIFLKVVASEARGKQIASLATS